MKTIFITFTRGLLVRNILRNKFFESLKNTKNIKIVLLFSQYSSIDGEYLKREFAAPNVDVVFVPNVRESTGKKIFMSMARNLVFSPTTKLYAKYGTSKIARKSRLTNMFLHVIYTPLSKSNFLKKIVRLVEVYIFRDSKYGRYFDTYNPDLVFSTALLSNFDLAFLKHARRRRIPALSMPKSWDNLDKILFRLEPDAFYVQNEHMKKDALEYQGFQQSKIKPVGFLQFDIYRDPAAEESREDYCQRHSFDPKLPIIFLGSEGLWSDRDHIIFEEIVKARDSGILPKMNILIRPHFSEKYDGRYDYLKNFELVFIDNTFRITEFFADHWDPTFEQMKDFTNTLRHCNVSVNFASTLSLDAVCFDKPVINIAYGIRYQDGKDVTPIMYETGFYKEVILTGATTMVYSPKELFSVIEQYLAHPEIKKSGRDKLRNRLCYNLDGQSGTRLYKELISHLHLAH